MTHVKLVEIPHQPQVLFRFCRWNPVIAGAAQLRQFALPHQAQAAYLRRNPLESLFAAYAGHFFLSHSSSVCS
jgi:hypothetical protein